MVHRALAVLATITVCATVAGAGSVDGVLNTAASEQIVAHSREVIAKSEQTIARARQVEAEVEQQQRDSEQTIARAKQVEEEFAKSQRETADLTARTQRLVDSMSTFLARTIRDTVADDFGFTHSIHSIFPPQFVPQEMRMITPEIVSVLPPVPTETLRAQGSAKEQSSRGMRCCCADMHKHCAAQLEGGNHDLAHFFHVTKCLAHRQSEFGDLQPACRDNLMHTVAGSCDVEIDEFCANVNPGAHRMHQCLHSHMKSLGAVCRDYVDSIFEPQSDLEAPATPEKTAQSVERPKLAAAPAATKPAKSSAVSVQQKEPASTTKATAAAVAAAAAGSVQDSKKGDAEEHRHRVVWFIVCMAGVGLAFITMGVVEWRRRRQMQLLDSSFSAALITGPAATPQAPAV